MNKWQKITRPPVLPLYLAAFVWPVAALALPIYRLWALALTAVLSAAVYLLGRRLCPDRLYWKKKAFSTGSQDVDAMLTAAAQDLDGLAAVAAAVHDKALAAELSRMDKAGRAILAEVERDPQKASAIDRFARYYLPEACKIMAVYARTQDVQGDNTQQLHAEIRATASTIAQAFENQLDALYSAEALDISTDIDVLETILKSQNLTD